MKKTIIILIPVVAVVAAALLGLFFSLPLSHEGAGLEAATSTPSEH